MRKPFISATSIALMAVGCWGLHINTNGWLGWASVGGILGGGIMLFLANIPPLNEERSPTSD